MMTPTALTSQMKYQESWVSEHETIENGLQGTLSHVFSQKNLERGEVPPAEHDFLEPFVEKLLRDLSAKQPKYRTKKGRRKRREYSLPQLARITHPDWGGESALHRVRSFVQQLFARYGGLMVDYSRLREACGQLQSEIERVEETVDDEGVSRWIHRFIPRNSVSARLKDIATKLHRTESGMEALASWGAEEEQECKELLRRTETLAAWHVATIIRMYRVKKLCEEALLVLSRYEGVTLRVKDLPITKRWYGELLSGEYKGKLVGFLESRVRVVDPLWREDGYFVHLEKQVLDFESTPYQPSNELLADALALTALVKETCSILQDEREIQRQLPSEGLEVLLPEKRVCPPVERLDAIARALAPHISWGVRECRGRVYCMAVQMSLRLCALYRFAQVAALVVEERNILQALRERFPGADREVGEGCTLYQELQEYWTDSRRLSQARISREGVEEVSERAKRLLQYAEREGEVVAAALVLQSRQAVDYEDANKKREQELFEAASSFHRHVMDCLEKPLLREIARTINSTLLCWLEWDRVAQFLQDPVGAPYSRQMAGRHLDEEMQKTLYGPLRERWNCLLEELKKDPLFIEYACRFPDSFGDLSFGAPPPRSILGKFFEKISEERWR